MSYEVGDTPFLLTATGTWLSDEMLEEEERALDCFPEGTAALSPLG